MFTCNNITNDSHIIMYIIQPFLIAALFVTSSFVQAAHTEDADKIPLMQNGNYQKMVAIALEKILKLRKGEPKKDHHFTGVFPKEILQQLEKMDSTFVDMKECVVDTKTALYSHKATSVPVPFVVDHGSTTYYALKDQNNFSHLFSVVSNDTKINGSYECYFTIKSGVVHFVKMKKR